MRKKIAAGNWKMNLTLNEAQGLTSEIISMYKDEIRNNAEMILAPPFPFLAAVGHLIKDVKGLSLAAQNVHAEEKGAFTGEVSAAMLASLGCRYCLVGHSERRHYFGEDNALLFRKAKILMQHEIIPVYCLGETLAERESGKMNSVLETQLREGLFAFSQEEIASIVIAYEPVWAIGTGKTASPEQAQEVHHFLRELLRKQYGNAIADEIPILYGGSVTPATAHSLFSQPDIDGGLVGGASLKSRDFVEIAKSFA